MKPTSLIVSLSEINWLPAHPTASFESTPEPKSNKDRLHLRGLNKEADNNLLMES